MYFRKNYKKSVGNKLEIISVKRPHVKRLASIYVRAYKTRGENWTQNKAEKLLLNYLAKQSDMALAVKVDGQLAGAFLGIIQPWWDGNHIIDTELFVDTRYQNRGAAKALFRALILKAKKEYRATMFEGITFSNMPFPMSWYRRLGIRKSKGLMSIEGNINQILRKLR